MAAQPPNVPEHVAPSAAVDDETDARLLPAQIKPFLNCPCCVPQAPFVAPTTLRCGHTVCARHIPRPANAPTSLVPKPGQKESDGTPPESSDPSPARAHLLRCPIPTCTQAASTSAGALNPNIPSESRVTYHPAPPTESANEDDDDLSHLISDRADVTVAKVMSVIERSERAIMEEEARQALLLVPTLPQLDGEHTDDEGDANDEPDDDRYSLPPSASRGTSADGTAGNGSATSSADTASLSGSVGTSVSRSSLHSVRHRSRSEVDFPSPESRPRKRRRRANMSPSPTSIPRPDEPRSAQALFEKELMTELTCEICFMLFYQPVTAPCQHTFCVKCLQRSLDYSSTCPLCRHELPGFAYFQDHPQNKLLLSIILRAFPGHYRERTATIEAEERDSRLDTPIFVCLLSFPGVPTYLHFFEPRYRLMLRRCLETPPHRFGMIMPPRAGQAGQTEYGTMLEIRNVQMLADGRSMVETFGTHRFRVLERGTLDGYVVGRVERIDDFEEELESDSEDAELFFAQEGLGEGGHVAGVASSVRLRMSGRGSRGNAPAAHPVRSRGQTSEELMETCRNFLIQLRAGTAPWVVQRLNNTYGPMPEDAASFSFWMGLVLPIDEHEKAKLLPIKSPRLRLKLIVHWIEELNSNWWFSSGCVVL